MTKRFKHIPGNASGKQDCRRKFDKECEDKYKNNKFFDNCEFEQKKLNKANHI